MNSHVNNTCSNALYYLYNIRKIRKYFSRQSTETLIRAFVLSRVDYCNILLYGLPAYKLTELQRVQNATAKLIFQESKYCHVRLLLYNLHWLPVKFRIDFKILLLTYKTINGLAPFYLQELINLKEACKYKLRSDWDGLLLNLVKCNTLTTLLLLLNYGIHCPMRLGIVPQSWNFYFFSEMCNRHQEYLNETRKTCKQLNHAFPHINRTLSQQNGDLAPQDEWWSLGTSSLPRSLCVLALLILFKSLYHETKSLNFATFIRNQLLIPETMWWVHIKPGYDFRDDLCVDIKSGYDSKDDVMCTQK